jgi:anti-anti-sigma regulatory factor
MGRGQPERARVVVGEMRTEVHTRRPFGADDEDVAGWRVLRVTGEVGGATAGLLPTLVVDAVRRGARNVCIDLSELEGVGPGGVDALRRCQHAARHEGGRLAVIRPDDPVVAQVLESSGVRRDIRLIAHREQLARGA